jgi:hypothetical protein
MRSWKTRAAVATATALVTGVGGVAALTLPAAGAPNVHVRKFVAVPIGHDHQVGKASFVGSEVERHHGRVVGTDSITGHFLVKKGVAKIQVAAAWKGGTVVIRGHATQNTPFVGKVIRGTGKYTGIEGTVTTRDLRHGKTAVTVTYTLP